MAIESPCSGCGQKLSVADEYAGRQARCPACGQIYTVPYSSTGTSDADSTGFSSRPSHLDETAPHSGSPAPINPAGTDSLESRGDSSNNQFWMQSTDQTEYGPVDRENLNRWFMEGRVGQGYRIRQGQDGIWQPAEVFRPQSNNPFAEGNRGSSPVAPTTAYPRHPSQAYQKGDPSGLVLTMGILAWVALLFCPVIGWIPGIVAWVAGRNGLRDIQAGIADPTNMTLVQVGYYLGMVNVILSLLIVIGFGGLIAISLVAGV